MLPEGLHQNMPFHSEYFIFSPPAALEALLLNHLSVSAEQNLTGQAEDEEVCYSFPFIETPGFLAEASALADRCHKRENQQSP